MSHLHARQMRPTRAVFQQRAVRRMQGPGDALCPTFIDYVS